MATTLLIILIMTCIILDASGHSSDTRWQKGNANSFFDNAILKLKRAEKLRSKISPLKADKIDFPGGRLSQICIQGLGTFSRSGSVTVTLVEDEIVIEAGIGLWNIFVNGYLEVQHLQGNFQVEAPFIRCRIKLTIALFKARLNYFEIQNLSQLKLTQMSGTGPLNLITKNMIQKKLRATYVQIRENLEGLIEKTLAKVLRSLNIFDEAIRLFETATSEKKL